MSSVKALAGRKKKVDYTGQSPLMGESLSMLVLAGSI